MAISDAMMAIILAQIAVYFGLLQNDTRWKRIVGALGMIAIGASTVVIEDSVPMFIFFGVSTILAGLQLLPDAAAMVRR